MLCEKSILIASFFIPLFTAKGVTFRVCFVACGSSADIDRFRTALVLFVMDAVFRRTIHIGYRVGVTVIHRVCCALRNFCEGAAAGFVTFAGGRAVYGDFGTTAVSFGVACAMDHATV